MKKIIKKILAPFFLMRQKAYQYKQIMFARSLAHGYGFRHLALLGKGKDSIVFRAELNGNAYVVKVLSDYAKSFLHVTKEFVEKVKSSALMQIEIKDDKVLIYPYADLESPNTSPKDLLKHFTKICDFQMEIIPQGFVMWDFGISGTNYMISNGNLRIIDYGGNAYLRLKPDNKEESCPRVNLRFARNNFIQQGLLLHFIVLGIGQTSAAKWASWIQDNENLEESEQVIRRYIDSTIYQKLGEIVFSLDLTTTDGWLKLKNEIQRYFDSNQLVTLDKAEIDDLTFNKDSVTVTGYQNYQVSRTDIQPLNQGPEWANTEKKWNIIAGQLVKLNFKTYLDIGSNLGLYVFTANVKCKAQATGIDYNQDYIRNCKKVAEYLNLDCLFETKEFGKIQKQYECVSMLGVIHHIYSRTESFGNLEKIIQKLDSISTKYIIIEFPTENDLKAMKWINIPSRNTERDYTLANFLNLSEKYFKKVSLIDSTTKDRPVYLLKK